MNVPAGPRTHADLGVGDALITPGGEGPNYRVIDVLHEFIGRQGHPTIPTEMIVTKRTITVTLEEEL